MLSAAEIQSCKYTASQNCSKWRCLGVGPHARSMHVSPCAWPKRDVAPTVKYALLTSCPPTVKIEALVPSAGNPYIISGTVWSPRFRTETFSLSCETFFGDHKTHILSLTSKLIDDRCLRYVLNPSVTSHTDPIKQPSSAYQKSRSDDENMVRAF